MKSIYDYRVCLSAMKHRSIPGRYQSENTGIGCRVATDYLPHVSLFNIFQFTTFAQELGKG